jgi:VCBS repeat-containing protein
VTITITAAANTPPVAVNDTATVAEGGSTTIAVTTNDTDANGTVDVTTVVITRQPTSGTATVNANGSITYANNGSEARTDSFGYKVKDNTGTLSNEATVTMTITAVNDAPVAANDTATVAEGGSTTIAVTTNDTDGDGTVDVTTVVITRQPTSGTATVNANGSVTYASNGSEVTADGFAYKVKDNSGALSNEATVTITITPVNDGPTAVNDAYTVAANGTLTVNAPGLLANDTDPDGAFLRLTEIFTPGHGTLSGVLSSGTFTYRPDTGYVGTDSFTYTVGDGAATSQGIVTITVTADPNNVAPVGNADSYTVNEDTVLTVNGPGLLANDTDANGQTLKVVSIGTEPTRGSLVLNDDGSFTYTPGPNLNGTDTFTYKASDGAADTAFTTVTINVAAVNDAPVINNDTIPIAKDTFVAFALGNRSSDVDGDVLTGTVVSGPQHGTFYFDTVNRGFSYQPNAGYTGTDSFTYKVSDGKLDSAIATVTLTVA